MLDEWFDGAVAVKLSLETLANLCTAGPDVDTNETAAREFQAVLTAVIKMSLPAKLGLLMRDDLAMASSLGGAGGGTGRAAFGADLCQVEPVLAEGALVHPGLPAERLIEGGSRTQV